MSKITSELLKTLTPQTPKAKRDRFLPYFNEALPRYGITNKKRVCAFLATVIMESDYLKATEEYASGWDYDISRNKKKALGLGNTSIGDGPKFKGRTLIQTTGKNNYQRVSDRIGVDFVKNPKLLAQPKYAVEGACIYWEDNKLNSFSDKGDFFAVQGLVNRGSKLKRAKDYAKREEIYNRALSAIPNDFKLETESVEDVEIVPDVVEEKEVEVKETEETLPERADLTPDKPSSENSETESSTKKEELLPKEKVAVVAGKRPNIFQRLYTKVAAAISGNVIFQFAMDQGGKLAGIALSPSFWWTILITVAVLTVIWITWEMVKSLQEKKRQAELDRLLVEENSTPNNFVQIIPADEVEIYRAKKYKIISRGESVLNENIIDKN